LTVNEKLQQIYDVTHVPYVQLYVLHNYASSPFLNDWQILWELSEKFFYGL